MFKIIHFFDKKHFGNQVLVYEGKNKNEDVYLAVIKDREEIVYFLLDSNLEKIYPINLYSYFKKHEIPLHNLPEHLDIALDIDLSKLGYSKCSDFIVKLIRDNSH